MKTEKVMRESLGILLLIFSVALIAGCGSGGGETTASTPSIDGIISGLAIKGPVANATVSCFAVNANGTKGGMMGTAQTDGQGNFSVSMGDYSGPVFCQMNGGSYMDEATGISMPMLQGDVLTCAIPFMSAGSTMSGIQMTPLTSMAQSMAQQMPGGMTSINIITANNAVSQYFTIGDVLQTRPMNPIIAGSGQEASQDMKNYGMTLAAMSQYASMIGMTSSSGMVTAMMTDASDGNMNGMMGSSGVMMGGGMMNGTTPGGGMMGGVPMPINAGTGGLADAMIGFIQSPMNKSGVTLQEMQNLTNKLKTSNGIIK